VLISFVVAHMTANGRTETRIAGNLVARAVTEAADDGAIFAAIFNLLDPNPEQRWPLDGPAPELTVGSRRVVVELHDEAARINPNTASPELLEALLRTTGSDAESARRLAASIGEWVGSAPSARQQDAQLANYQAAGLDYGPPSAPLETVDELGRVLGMTPALLGAIRPHLTLFGPSEPNPRSADPVVAAALSQIAPASQTAASGTQTAQSPLIVRITASTSGPGNARVARSAVVRVGTTSSSGYSVLAWGSRLD
jgi:general secretion pathway protein K